MYKTVAKLERDFHKLFALLGLMTEHGQGHRSKMLTKHPLPRIRGARGAAADPTGHEPTSFERFRLDH